MRRVASKGKCSLCGGEFTVSVMTRHVQACRKAHPGPLPGKGPERVTRLFHLVVRGSDAPGYWLHLEAPADATLQSLDRVLRDIWLECCGHLSAFVIEETTYFVEAIEPDDRDMRVALGETLDVGTAFSHQYDFGTATNLRLRVVAEREGVVRGKSIGVLARNEPLPLICQGCGKAATQVCSTCVWEDNGLLCNVCAADHECGEEMLLPVVNSPRIGMCAYAG
ncbi:MAG: hypothetical protein HY683_03565 [Chloroflexi bacterium]|nr:hypothetical protein [Chloroflexota bacterium]